MFFHTVGLHRRVEPLCEKKSGQVTYHYGNMYRHTICWAEEKSKYSTDSGLVLHFLLTHVLIVSQKHLLNALNVNVNEIVMEMSVDREQTPLNRETAGEIMEPTLSFYE